MILRLFSSASIIAAQNVKVTDRCSVQPIVQQEMCSLNDRPIEKWAISKRGNIHCYKLF